MFCFVVVLVDVSIFVVVLIFVADIISFSLGKVYLTLLGASVVAVVVLLMLFWVVAVVVVILALELLISSLL